MPLDELDAVETRRALENVAHLTWWFYKALREQGFRRGQALVLSVTWLTNMLNTAPPQQQ